ncbi:MAG: PilN domain-containing protein, partial [Hyphomicrobiaceae bacterium]|nr:PilN domain-containing protein [Hyphomicrobiaceae bacterium]
MASGTPALHSVAGSATRFLNWWRDELWGLMPERMRRFLTDADAGVILAQVDTGYQILTEEPPRGGSGGPQVLSRDQALSALAEMASSRRFRSVGIRLPIGQCFERRVELPRVAHDDMGRMLRFDLERATPFKAGDVFTAYLMAGEAGTTGKQKLRHLVVKREAVDPLLADVRAAGLEPAFVDCWQTTPASGLSVNFLEANAPARMGLARHVTPPRVLGLLVLVLAALASALELSRYETALAEITAQTAKMSAQAAAVRGTLERSDAAVGDLKRLQGLKLNQVSALAVIEELSRALPDSVWLTDLRIEGGVVDIAGLAKSGAVL